MTNAKILVISDGLVKTGKGELFHCLAGLEKVWHVGIDDALATYEETAEDGWDVAIIDCNDVEDRMTKIAQQILKMEPKQSIVMIENWCRRPYKSEFGLCVPRRAIFLTEALKKIGIGGDE